MYRHLALKMSSTCEKNHQQKVTNIAEADWLSPNDISTKSQGFFGHKFFNHDLLKNKIFQGNFIMGWISLNHFAALNSKTHVREQLLRSMERCDQRLCNLYKSFISKQNWRSTCNIADIGKLIFTYQFSFLTLLNRFMLSRYL